MAKPITLVTELSDADAKAFIKDQENPAPNPAAEKLVTDAKKLKLTLEDI